MRASDLKRLAYTLLFSLFMSRGVGLAQHMNAPNAPCRLGPNSAETQCFISEAQAADRELNATYNKIYEILADTTSDQNKLRAAQRLWVQFRDANCAAEYALCGGASAGPMAHAACLAAVTR